MSKEENTELDIAIDQNLLDQEWVNQPRMYFKYAALLAKARDDFSRAKSSMEVTDADLGTEIRKSPEDFEVGKVTEASIQQAINNNALHKAAKKKMLDCQYEVSMLEAAVEALNHKKKALEKLVDLRLANYFSSPKASEGSKENMDGLSKQSVRTRGRRDEE